MSTPTGQAIADALYEPSLAAAFSDYPTLWEKQCRAVLPLLDAVIAERDHARVLCVIYEQMLHMTPEERDVFMKPRVILTDRASQVRGEAEEGANASDPS